MTRFMANLNGHFGDYWKKDAEKELQRVREELDNGEITIDENGVARNCIGRALASDMIEKVALVTDLIDMDATQRARDKEVDESIAEYRRNARPATQEELMEMRAAFGPGETVVDILTGQTYYL